VRKLRGLVVATVTPMYDDGSIDLDSFRGHLRDLLDNGVEGLFVAGTTGEGLFLSPGEQELLVRTAVEFTAGRAAVVGHCAALGTESVVTLTRRLHHAGADGVAALTPFYYKVDANAMIEHFRRVADAAECPTYLYSIPGATGVDLPVSVVESLARHPHFGGVKYSNHDMEGLRRYIETGVDVFIGCDPLITEAMRQGAAGTVSGTAGCLPAIHAALFRRLRDGTDPSAAQAKVTYVDSVLARLPAVAGYKTVLQKRGVIASAAVRRPLRGLGPEEQRQLAGALEEVRA